MAVYVPSSSQFVGDGSERNHDNKGDSVGRDGEKLSSCFSVSETLDCNHLSGFALEGIGLEMKLTNGRQETADGSQSQVHATTSMVSKQYSAF
jgi:hypothetical protein